MGIQEGKLGHGEHMRQKTQHKTYKCDNFDVMTNILKGIVHPNMKIGPRLSHPQGILDMSDILLSDEHIQSYIQNGPVCSNLYNCSEWCPFLNLKIIKSIHPS